MKRRFAVVALLPLCFATPAAVAQEQSPLQADVQVEIKYNDKGVSKICTVEERLSYCYISITPMLTLPLTN